MKSTIIIAIDGFSSTGKSTIAKQLAKHLGYVYVDTGAMYRTVALYAIENNLIIDKTIQERELISHLENINITFKYNSSLGFSEVYLNGINVESKIRGMRVSSYVSKVAAISDVRKKLVSLQQKIGISKGVVMDGRDIGTVVFPDAELKLFITASTQTKAQRRFDELQAKGEQSVTYQEVYDNVVERDRLDTTRKDSPLIMASDAIKVDNSNMSREEQFAYILSLLEDKF